LGRFVWLRGVYAYPEGLERDVEEIFFAEVVQGKDIVDLHDAGAGMAFGDLGPEVASFEADEAGGDGQRFRRGG